MLLKIIIPYCSEKLSGYCDKKGKCWKELKIKQADHKINNSKLRWNRCCLFRYYFWYWATVYSPRSIMVKVKYVSSCSSCFITFTFRLILLGKAWTPLSPIYALNCITTVLPEPWFLIHEGRYDVKTRKPVKLVYKKYLAWVLILFF